jgi:hypothetical protein
MFLNKGVGEYGRKQIYAIQGWHQRFFL